MSRRPKKKAVTSPPYQSSEELYQALFEQTTDGIFITDAQGHYVEVNQRGCEMLGYTREEILALSIEDLIPAEELAHNPLQLDALRAGKTLLRERCLRCKDGSLLPVEINTRMLSNGSFLGMVRDISKRKQAIEQLKNSEARWRSLLQSIPAFVVEIDPAGIIQSLNRTQSGFAVEDFVGQAAVEVTALAGREAFQAAFSKVIKTGQIVQYEAPDYGSHGALAWYSHQLAPILKDNQIVGVIMVVTDITERKQAEATVQEREAFLQAIFDNSLNAIMIVDDLGNYRSANQAAADLLGYSVEELRRMNVSNLKTTSTSNTEEQFRQYLITGREIGEFEFVRPDGETRIAHYQAVRVDENFHLSILTDITVAKEREEALRQSEAKWRTLAETVTDVIMTIDRDGKLLFINRSVTGAGLGQFIGKNFYDFVMDEYRDIAREHIESVFQTGKPTSYEVLGPKGLNPPRWFITRVGAVQQGEAVIAATIIATDITELKQANEALRASESRFRAFVDHASDAFFLHDEWGTILDVNRQACESLGYSRQEMVGISPLDLDVDFSRSSLEQLLTRLAADEMVAFETHHRRKDGSVFPVEVRTRPFWQGEHRFAVSLAHDITERKQANEALRASEERFRALYHENPSMFFTLNAEGIIISVNDFGANQLGYTKDELEGQSVLNVFYEEDKTPVSEQLKICLLNPRQVYYWQFRKIHKDGSLMWVEEFARTVNGPDGTIYVLVVCQNITKRKQLEAENEQLTAQFYQAQKMESIGRLAGGIAHDFNNLLVPIIGYIDLNLIDLPPESGLYADLTQVRKAADRAAGLTRQILAFSRQQVLELRLLDLNTVIEEFKKMLQRLIGEHIQLQTFLSSSLFPIKADRGQIEQVLMNLAINARDAMPAGGQLTIETVNIFLDEAYLEKYASDLMPGSYVMLAVSDTGHGMDVETRKRIFDPFFTTKESGKGTGLGLATVFGIIKQHQGHIWVYSEPGQGTTFKIYLPKAKDTTETTIPITQEPISIYGTETVMVVEDDEMVRKLVCETLEAQGYDVIEAQSSADCLELAAGKDIIHLLLTDVIMPEMNGKELYQKLKSIHPNTRVLYMSGYTNNVIVHHSILDEGVNFLQKPFTVQNLARKVREVLG